MAKVTHVAKAQQRYAIKPVLNEDGTQKETPVMVKNRDGVLVQKKTKRGTPVTMKVTVADKSQPLPMPVCESCRTEIKVGTPYKHVTPKTGVYGGRQRNRHESCPNWHPWDLSNSTSARCEQIVYDAETDEFTTESEADDMEATLSAAAEEIRELAQEKEDAADNMEDGFGHATGQSDELRELADSLREWADEVEQADIPEKPTEDDLEEDETMEERLERWVEEVVEARDNVLGNSPA